MAHLSDYNIENKYEAIVRKTKRLTPEDSEEVREMVIEVNQPNFEVQVDQSFGVLLEENDDFGNQFHHRLYSVADIPSKKKGKTEITMLVKRCNYVDEFSGELQQGLSSNYLCDRKVGDTLTLTGPFDLPFKIPMDLNANLILIGMGTGIAPFRAFVKHIYTHVKDWKGNIRLFYGAKSGLELFYMNDANGDLTNYYDNGTFEAFHALSPRPHWDDPIPIDSAVQEKAVEILNMLNETNTYIYVAGYEKIKEQLDRAFSKIMGSDDKWFVRKAELIAGNKWAEIIY